MKKRPDSEAYFLQLQRRRFRLAEQLEVTDKRIARFSDWKPAKTGKPGPRTWTRQDRKEKARDAGEDAFWTWLQGLPSDSVVFTDSEESLLAVWTAAQKQLTKETK